MNGHGKENGFTLIEAMVAMVIAATILLAMGLFTVAVMRSDNTAKQRTVATHVAEQQLEQWFSTNTAPAQATTVTVNGTTYQLQSFDAIPVSGVSNSPMTGAGTNTNARAITVYWKNASGVHQVTVANMQRM
ncbi:MAG TPA: prepilin-type N-terminal cleavage/methylation domain-containing protein [Mariprofundaceae bacterium]|nr:prepilin-type N-terminal cleavage/methylation domain-containing protein [Mariprofundaceae bacterium]